MNASTETAQDHGLAMDRMYRWQRHIYDASRRYYLLGRNEMLRRIAAKPAQTILEIGCGTGRNLNVAARLYPDCKFFGIDISNEMLKTATANLSRAGMQDKVQLAQGDATNFDAQACFQKQNFDHIYFSYTLSMVPNWQDAIAHALTMLNDTGQLHIVDFGQFENCPASFRTFMFSWLKRFDVTPRPNLQNVLELYEKEQSFKLQFTKSFGGYVYHGVLRKVQSA